MDIVIVFALEPVSKIQGLILQLPMIRASIASLHESGAPHSDPFGLWHERWFHGLQGLTMTFASKKNCSRANNNLRMWLPLQKKIVVGNPLEVHRRPLECTGLSDIDFRLVFPPPSCQISHDMTCTNLFTLHRLLYPDSFSAETQTRKTTWFFGLSANEVVATAVGKFLRCSKTIIVLPIPNEQHTSSCPAEKKI